MITGNSCPQDPIDVDNTSQISNTAKAYPEAGSKVTSSGLATHLAYLLWIVKPFCSIKRSGNPPFMDWRRFPKGLVVICPVGAGNYVPSNLSYFFRAVRFRINSECPPSSSTEYF